ncbi:MAG: DNA-directed RNA polymerase subunit alpha C-terminal domain-containing protein [Patescibacteria group bacterium]
MNIIKPTTTVVVVIEQALAALSETAQIHVAEFYRAVEERLRAEEEVSDAEFVATLQSMLYFSRKDMRSFATDAQLLTQKVNDWLSAKNLPPPHQRLLILKLCSHDRLGDIDVMSFIQFVCGERSVRKYDFTTPVDEMFSSVRVKQSLHEQNIHTLGQLLSTSEAELLRGSNFGRKSLADINEVIEPMGFWLNGSQGRGLYPGTAEHLDSIRAQKEEQKNTQENVS